MRAVLSRVRSARVVVDGETVGEIGPGLLAYVGLAPTDGPKERSFLLAKIVELRIFEDGAGKMNRSLLDIGGSLLLVSQFTLFGDASRGRRPSFTGAMDKERAGPEFEALVAEARTLVHTETGRFQAHMRVTSENDGPITLILDTDELMKRGSA